MFDELYLYDSNHSLPFTEEGTENGASEQMGEHSVCVCVLFVSFQGKRQDAKSIVSLKICSFFLSTATSHYMKYRK